MSRILVVDDNATERRLLEAILGRQGHQTLSARNGEQALELARRDIPDLIITDIMMPAMDGFQLCRSWKSDAQLRAIPFVFYTASFTEAEHERFALSLGADRFVLKPQPPEVLLSLVQELLAGAAQAGDRPPAQEMDYLREHNEILFRKLETKWRDLHASQQLVQNLLENSPSLVYILDREGRFLHLNHRLELILGRSQAEVTGQTREAFLPRAMAEQHLANDRRVLESGIPLTFEETSLEPDGEHVYLTVKFPLRDDQGEAYAVCGISTDMTEHRKLERDHQKLVDLHVMLYQVNRTIRSAATVPDLLETVCHLCVDFGKFDLAWIGWAPLPGKPLRADHLAGPLAHYAEGLEIPLDSALPEAHGPSAVCVRENRQVVCQDWDTDPMVAPWRAQSGPYGIRASSSLPILLEDRVLAVLNLYSVQPGFFTQDRLGLIREMVQDVAHAIRSMAQARQRDQAERALVAQEMEYRAAFEQGAVGMAQVSLEGRFLKVNRQLCELFGYLPEELVGRPVGELTHPEDQPMTADLLRDLQAGRQEVYRLQKRYLRRDGTAVWVDLNGAVVRDPGGQAMYFLSTFSDITQRRVAEQRIQEERSRFQGLLQSIPDLVWLKDLEGRYQYCNPRFEAYCGRSQEQLAGKTDHDLVDRAQAERFTGHDHRVMELGGQVRDEVRVTFADGHEELLEIVKTLMRDAAGQPVGVLGIARDVTRNRVDQERLRKLSNAIEHSPIVVVITDRNGTIEHINPRFTELTGYTPEEAIGANPRILKSGLTPPGVYEELWRTILGGHIWHMEIQNRKKNGELYWEATSISPIFDDAGRITHFVALKEDITDLKRIQAELQDQLTELRRWHEATLGRESRNLDLKREVNDLLARLGEAPRYESAGPDGAPEGRP